jgi:hypothetical protein
MAAAAASAGASRTPGRRRAQAAACHSLVTTAFEAKNGHFFVNIGRFALRAGYRLIALENQSLETLTAVAAFIFVYRHLTLQRSNQQI